MMDRNNFAWISQFIYHVFCVDRKIEEIDEETCNTTSLDFQNLNMSKIEVYSQFL